ncbi:MAG: TonB-dependent receptor [Bacteroidales bacterium]|nr:TonB-dependent receptor [Bacteroidales bacterium]
MKRLVVFFIFIAATVSVFAQTGTVRGFVLGPDGKSLDFASVVLRPSGMYTLTDAEGRFTVENVPSGKVDMEISFFGMEKIDTSFTLPAGHTLTMKFRMVETSFSLEKVTVTAKRSEAGKSTASEISRQAMDHLQTSSLQDIMGLIPGVALSNPNLNKASAISVRDNVGSNMASLGTAVLVDGAPVSNNANLQFLSSSVSGDVENSATKSVASSGTDIRSLSTDNIESVEIIRGIPSVEYGDLTSGAVLVKSKAGKSPLTIRLKTNPNIYQASASKGFSLSGKAGDLNLSGDYAYNRKDLVRDFDSYQRFNAKALWSFMPGGSGATSMNTSLSFTFARDRAKPDPDSYYGKEQSWGNTLGVSFNHNGHSFVNKGWLKNINWLVSGSYNDKVTHVESVASNALNLYSTAMEDGVTYTNTPGQHLFDKDGNEITNASDKNLKAVILPYSYFYIYNIYGKELNVFAKANADFSKTWGPVTNRILVGADFKTDGNLGKGAVYNDDAPPFRSIGNASSGYRRRNYYDIPFVNQIGVYAEDTFQWILGSRTLNIVGGARFDWVNGLTSVAPRMNASFDIFPWMTLRGGWGISTKAPTSMYLYPNYAYQDVANFNGMSTTLPEEEKLLVATTRVYDSTNPNLQIPRNRKAEIGLDFKIAERYTVAVTWYDELMTNGLGTGLDLPSFIWSPYQTYKISQQNPGTQPTLEKDAVYNMFFLVYKPYNNGKHHNKGLEYEIDLGRFDAIRTSFNISGAWSYGSSTNASYSFQTRTNGNSPEHHIGIYNPERVVSHYENLITTLRATHNIPEIGFVITLTAQADWYSAEWSTYNNPDMFVKYISYKDGQVHDFDPALKSDPEFAYLFDTPSPLRGVVEKTSPYFLVNLNLSKEIGDFLTASFYVNNILNYRPKDRYEASGAFRELGIPMFFGFEMKINIK